MASNSEFAMNDWKKKWTRWGAGMALLALTGLALPQDYQGLMSTSGRSPDEHVRSLRVAELGSQHAGGHFEPGL